MKPADFPLTDKPDPSALPPVMHGTSDDPRPVAKDLDKPTTAELKAQADWDLRHVEPLFPPGGSRPVAKDPLHPTAAELAAQSVWDAKAADADAARANAAAKTIVVVDDRVGTLIGAVSGRTDVIAHGLEHDAAVLEQLRAQMAQDQRELRIVTTAQLEVINVVVARVRAYAAQLVSLCASREVPLPTPPTVPTPPSVPPPRA